jgi:hypothetical protein
MLCFNKQEVIPIAIAILKRSVRTIWIIVDWFRNRLENAYLKYISIPIFPNCKTGNNSTGQPGNGLVSWQSRRLHYIRPRKDKPIKLDEVTGLFDCHTAKLHRSCHYHYHKLTNKEDTWKFAYQTIHSTNVSNERVVSARRCNKNFVG